VGVVGVVGTWPLVFEFGSCGTAKETCQVLASQNWHTFHPMPQLVVHDAVGVAREFDHLRSFEVAELHLKICS